MTKRVKKPRRPPEIDAAVKELRAASRAELAKKEVVQFRIDTDDLQRLYRVCAKHKKPVGTLVREWVLQMTDTENKQEALGLRSGETNLLVRETIDIDGLWDLGVKKPSQNARLQKLYERYKFCRQEELAVVNELMTIILES